MERKLHPHALACTPGVALTDADVPLLDKGDGLLEGLAELEADQHYGEATAAEGRDGEGLALLQALLGGDEAHVEELLNEAVGDLHADGVLRVGS